MDSLEEETEIIWKRSPETMDYVRQRKVTAGTRSGEIPENRIAGEIVGYAVVAPDAITMRYGQYRRRIFYLKDHDRFYEGEGVYATGVPAEAVDPLTVAPGVEGVVTPQARGGDRRDQG